MEGKPAPVNNFEYKKGDEAILEKRYESLWWLRAQHGQTYLPQAEWTLDDQHILGLSSIYNSPLSASQLRFAIAMSRHPLVEKLLTKSVDELADESGNDQIVLQRKQIGLLQEAQVLAGLKVLDMGCGPRPLYARVSRALGADVYTVDKMSSTEFEVSDEYKNSQYRELEIKRHLQIDLNWDDAEERIRNFSGGQFGLITEAHLISDDARYTTVSKQFKVNLLRTGGVYFDGQGPHSMFVKEASK